MEERMDFVESNIALVCTLVGLLGVVFAIIVAANREGCARG
jgi:hypothetical protein